MQPNDGALGYSWPANLGVEGLAEDLGSVLPAVAFGIGLTFGFTFDTTGPRRVVEREDAVEGEPERGYIGPIPAGTRTEDEPVAAERREVVRDESVDGDREVVATPRGRTDRTDDD
jgi:hypothetical protein